MKIKSLIVGMSVLLSIAVVPEALAAKTGAIKIKSVSVGSSGNVFVKTSGSAINPASCSISGTYMIDGGDPLKKEYMAILLTARAAGLNSNLTLSNSNCVNAGKYAKIANVELL